MTGTILFDDDVFSDENGENTDWKNELRRLLPSHEVVPWRRGSVNTEAVRHWDNIEYAVIWDVDVEKLMELPKLRAVLLLGAGADHMHNIDSLPEHIPLVCLADGNVAHSMAMYAAHWVLHYHFSFHKYALGQKSIVWRELPGHEPFEEFTVGIMGYGRIGRVVGNMMRQMGYRVCAWSRTSSDEEGILMYNGEHLQSFLGQVNALVNVLPLTRETANLLDDEKLRLLPEGAIFINIGRAGTVVDKALCAALDRGHLAAAVLDTFREEPLPTDSPYWRHEKVVVTPHMSGRSYARSSAKYIADNIRRMQAGERPFPVIDRKHGY